MYRLLLSVVLMSATSVVIYGQSQKSKPKSALEQQLIQLEREWQLTRDLSVMNRLMADDWIGISSRTVSDKADNIAQWGTVKLFDDLVVTISDIRVRVYDKSAVITSLLTTKGKIDGESITIPQRRYTNVWVKNKVGWQCVATHSSVEDIMPKQEP
jgi:ketosteroid isomerase-like protein